MDAKLPVDHHRITQRLSELLRSFPAAVVAGVEWNVLLQKYEEHHGTKLDWQSLGYASPFLAAAALFQDDIRVASAGDPNKLFIGVQDSLAMETHPRLLGCWPSLYQAVCKVVLENGFKESSDQPTVVASLLLAQLRPLLQSNWHPQFDEKAMGHCCERGHFKRFKKMKHMLDTVVRLRKERQAWQKSCGLELSEVDHAIAPLLEFIPSKKHNDLLLRCTVPAESTATRPETSKQEMDEGCMSELPKLEDSPLPFPFEPAPPMSVDGEAVASVEDEVVVSHSIGTTLCDTPMIELQLEVERLRAENRKLRNRNLFLEEHIAHSIPEAGMSPLASPGRRCRHPAGSDDCSRPGDVFDNPFEPPPQKPTRLDGAPSSRESRHSSSDFGSTDVGSVMMTNLPGWQSGYTSANISGSTTPSMRSPFARPGCTYVPMWVPFMNSPHHGLDLSIIRSGIVRERCDELESR